MADEAADQGASPPQKSNKKKDKQSKQQQQGKQQKGDQKECKQSKSPESVTPATAKQSRKPDQAGKMEDGKQQNRPDSGKQPGKEQKQPEGGKQAEKPGAGKDGNQAQGSSGDGTQPSKAELKRQRREKQEAQRAAKAKAQSDKKEAAPGKKEQQVRVPDSLKADVPETQKRVAKKLEKQQIPKRTSAQRKVRLFNHLQQYEKEFSLTKSMQFSGSGGIHPAMIRLGLQYAEGVVSGSNARCIALLAALKSVIADYSTPPKEELCRDLASKIKPYISFLDLCRPKSVSMGNAIKYVKWHITHIPANCSDSEAKHKLYGAIDDFLQERILLAAKGIANEACNKIADGDVILVFSCSSLVMKVLCDAKKKDKKFRVIVADSRPKLEGRECLRRLVQAGIKCSYVLINAVSYIMPEATKVILGAHGLMANGFVMSRVGTALISLIAKARNVPVLVCCETYKFCERVQTDSFVFNELGDPDDLVDIGKTAPYLWDWRDFDKLTLLNLMYDFTPPEFVSMVITELGMIPCTSVPVVLRMKQAETNET